MLGRFFTELDGPVFALINLPEVVKGALFARYSRSSKGLRRLFLDEFVNDPEAGLDSMAGQVDSADPSGLVSLRRAEQLYERVFTEFGDDSVAQLGGAHIACEDVSNIATKIIERGRLMAYLEQSTRYIQYDSQVGGRYRYYLPEQLIGSELGAQYESQMDGLFREYSTMFEVVRDQVVQMMPPPTGEADAPYRAAVRAKVCDALRGLLPAATRANVGIFGTGQGYEALVMRMRASANLEAIRYSDLILGELKKVMPSFLRRVEIPDRGGAWINYLIETKEAVDEAMAGTDFANATANVGDTTVTLTNFDPDGEIRVASAIGFEAAEVSDSSARRIAGQLSGGELDDLFDTYVGERLNRRHRPGRAFEATQYRFEIVSDYGAFRDLQRHRILTIEWQPLTTRLGYTTPDLVEACNLSDSWDAAMADAGRLYETLSDEGAEIAQYCVPMAYRIRYVIEMNAREAMHLIELRTSPQAHPEYRRVCLEMHRLIDEVAGHRRIAGAMLFVGEDSEALERLAAERRSAERRRGRQ